MLNLLQSWKGPVEVNGVQYESISEIPADLQFEDGWSIKLCQPPKKTNLSTNTAAQNDVHSPQEVRITVKPYMTKKASPEFDFMAKWNNDVPMPMVTMTGYQVKETRGMVYMKLHGDIWAQKISTCMCCGRKLTNPVSQYFGIGPECGNHNYVNPFDSEEELREAVSGYKKKLQNTTWEGWVIKSAIKEEVPV